MTTNTSRKRSWRCLCAARKTRRSCGGENTAGSTHDLQISTEATQSCGFSSMWIDEFSKRCGTTKKKEKKKRTEARKKPRQAPACLQKYNEAGYAVKLSKCDEILGTAKQLSEKQSATVSISPHLHFCLKSVQTVEHLPIQTLTRQWTLSQWPVAMLSPKSVFKTSNFSIWEKPALLHQTSHSNHCTNKYALLFLY